MLVYLTLKSDGYINAVDSDKGKLISDDGVTIGVLIDFNNSVRMWTINTPLAIAGDSVMVVVDGTGSGVAESAATATTNYCTKDDVKDRLIIKLDDISFDINLDISIEEASRIVDIFLKPYVTVPLENVSDQIKHITADFASSVFKRRYMPQEVKIRGSLQPDMINDVDGVGWFAVGLRKLQDYIKSYYILAQTIGNTAHNPDVFSKLHKDGIITGKEARAFINAATEIVKTEIETLTKTLNLTETDIINKTITENITVVKETTDGLTKTDDITRTENLTKTQQDTITKDETKTLEQTEQIEQTKTLTDTKTLQTTDTQVKDVSTLKSDIITEQATKKLSDEKTLKVDKTKTLDQEENIDITSVKDDTKKEYHTRKQKSFSFVESDKNDGYKEQSD